MALLPDLRLKGSYDALAGQVAGAVDGLLLSGGSDMDAALFGDRNYPFNGAFQEERDLFEIALAREAVSRGMPVLGICRGAQVLNVALGGTLYQDIHKQNEGRPLLMHYQKAPDYSCVHDVAVAAGSVLARALVPEGAAGDAPAEPDDAVAAQRVRGWIAEAGAGGPTGGPGGLGGGAGGGPAGGAPGPSPPSDVTLRVNSFHHQAVRDVAPGMSASAWAPDGVVEAIEPAPGGAWPGHPFTLGVQWHPERLWRHYRGAWRLFRAFALACQGRFP
jgi:putative glutamine amidotransferase